LIAFFVQTLSSLALAVLFFAFWHSSFTRSFLSTFSAFFLHDLPEFAGQTGIKIISKDFCFISLQE
jgi:hypothetical protein